MTETKLHWLVRKVVSWLANLTPNVVYYPSDWTVKINDVQRKMTSSQGKDRSPLTVSAMAMACAMHEYLKPGDEANISLIGVTRHDENIGDFVVIIKRT